MDKGQMSCRSCNAASEHLREINVSPISALSGSYLFTASYVLK